MVVPLMVLGVGAIFAGYVWVGIAHCGTLVSAVAETAAGEAVTSEAGNFKLSFTSAAQSDAA